MRVLCDYCGGREVVLPADTPQNAAIPPYIVEFTLGYKDLVSGEVTERHICIKCLVKANINLGEFILCIQLNDVRPVIRMITDRLKRTCEICGKVEQPLYFPAIHKQAGEPIPEGALLQRCRSCFIEVYGLIKFQSASQSTQTKD